MNGILNIHKPVGLTSFDVVARIKRWSKQRRTGHAGTLDPQASGVLPVCLGQATRIIEYLFNETKTYRAQVVLGISTDSFDSAGQVTRTADASGINREMVSSALERFRGTILQKPPMYSALKFHGQPLYKLARSGIEVDLPPRPAVIHSLEITDWQPPVVTLEVVCGKGTYIRSLAHDLGESLGCGASLQSLVRLQVGPFSLQDALTLPQLEEAFRSGTAEKFLHPLDFVLWPFHALVVNREKQCALVHGHPISLDPAGSDGLALVSPEMLCRVYTEDGGFVGMVKYDAKDGCWRPQKIFQNDCCQAASTVINTE
jgi:tRNA pseudouridine55 synthase